MSDETNTLLADATCFRCVPRGMQLPVLIYLAATAAGVSTDPNVLMSNASCIGRCLPKGLQIPALISILDDLLNGEIPVPTCVNVIPDGATYTPGQETGLPQFDLTLVPGRTYQIAFLNNDADFVNGSSGEISSNGTFVASTGPWFLIGTGGGEPVTATICQIQDCNNLVPAGAMYGIFAIYSLTIVAGATYEITWGPNEFAAYDNPNGNIIQYLSTGSGAKTTFTSTSNLLYFFAVDFTGLSVTATICQV